MGELLPRLTLVLGGARSGKSRHAEGLIRSRPAPWTYIATGQAFDEEMRARIDRHRQDRGDGWITLEEPLELPAALLAPTQGPVLVDCLTLWLSNLMLLERDLEIETERLLAALAQAGDPVVLVSNEVGMGIVPENALARAFRDAAGRLNQRVAALADRVVLVVAGLPMTVKQENPHG